MIYFISGHREISVSEFDSYYVPKLRETLRDPESKFVVGDYSGVDSLAQIWLAVNIPDHLQNNKVTVYHMFDKPRNLKSKSFKTIGGFLDDVSRDSAMTKASDIDIAYIRPGQWTSGTAQNILRRYEMREEIINETYKNPLNIINSIKEEYKNNDLCIGELLAYYKADGLSLEDAYEVYKKLKHWAGDDEE